jgi:hypothetical protein
MDFSGYEDLNLVGYLYNTCFGGFFFSDEFEEEYKKRCEAVGKSPMPYAGQDRADPIAVALFQEWGPERSSGDCSKLKLYWVPQDLLAYASEHEYDGKESVRVSAPNAYAFLLKTFLDDYEKNPSLSVADLKARHEEMSKKFRRFREFLENVYFKKPVE